MATKTPGASSLIEDRKTGLLINIGDKQELTQALSELLEKPDLRDKLAHAAQESARKYDSREIMKKVVDFWKKIAGEKK